MAARAPAVKDHFRDLSRLALRYPGKAAAIVYWFVTGKRVRARGRLRDAVARLPFDPGTWIGDCAARDASALVASEAGKGASSTCTLGVHLHIGPGQERDAAAAIASVLAQSWPHWRLIVTTHDGRSPRASDDSRIRIVADARSSRTAGLKAALDAIATSYLVPLPADCRLPREALLAYAAVIGSPGPDEQPVFYGDQIESVGHWRGSLWLKPEWDSDMFLAQDYLSAACALPVEAARAAISAGHAGEDRDVLGCAAVYALLLRMAVLDGCGVRHLHRITASTPRGHWHRACPDRLLTLRGIVAPPLGLEVADGPFGTATIRWPLPEPAPLVSIVIPTRDRLDLLQPCVESVLGKTRYTPFEIVIADNGSVEAATLAFLDRIRDDPRVRVASWPHPYNYSAINNFAVRATRGTYVCLLNNDIDVIDGAWLGNLMRQACRPGVGAAGARLLYPDRSIQHAGVAVGMGNAAGHAHRGLAEGEFGYFAHALIARRATAVTGACLVVSRALFDAVGGLDEHNLAIAYNDVDFCLKLRAAGATNIYEPDAVLIHHESKSRGFDMAPEHLERYMQELAVLQERWDTTRFQDPTHHPILDRLSEQYLTP